MEHGKDAILLDRVTSATHSQSSQTFEPKSINRKAVFRPVLTSPFTAKWPSISNADANVLFHTLLDLLRSDAIQNAMKRTNEYLPRQSARKTRVKNEKRKARLQLAKLIQSGIATPSIDNSEKEKRGGKNPLENTDRTGSQFILCGLNSITRTLEEAIADSIHSQSSENETDLNKHRSSIIFVCNADISPASLTSHIPLLVATYNALCRKSILLVPLPLECQLALSNAVKLRRCGLISIDREGLNALNDLEIQRKITDLELKIDMSELCPMRMTWLEEAAATVRNGKESMQHRQGPKMNLIAPHIKHLKSSTPLDLNAKKDAKKIKRTKRKVARKMRASAKSKAT